MATRYGYDKAIGLTGPLSVNWEELTNSTVKYLNEIQEKKDTEKKEVAKEARDLAVKLSENPFDYTSNMYAFYGKAANGAIALNAGIEKDYADRKISKTDRDIKIANGKSQIEQYISASSLYAEQEKERAKKAGPNGSYGAEDIFENEILSTALNYENIEPMWDPDSATFNALVTFGDGTKRIMSSNQLYRSQQRPEIGEYDMNKNIKEQFENIGVKTITRSDGSVVAGNFVTKQGEDADNALKNLAEAMVQQPTQLRSMLSTYPISIEEDGEVNTYKFSREFLPQEAYDVGTGEIKKDVLKKLQDENPTIFYRDIQGNYYESDKAKEIGEKYAMERLTLAAKYTEKETPDEKPKDKVRETLDLINTVRLSGGKVPATLFTQLLKDKGLTDEEIAATFPDGIEEDAFNELSINLESLLTGLTPELLQSSQVDNKKNAKTGAANINKELRKLRSVGITATYDRGSKQITLNKLGGKEDDANAIDIEGLTLTQIYDSILNEIPLYQSIDDIFTLLEFQGATRKRREGEGGTTEPILN